MARIERTVVVDRDGLDALRTARTDLLVEKPNGDDAWGVDTGPFRHYERTIEVRHDDTSTYEVTERIDFKLAVPLWWPYLSPLMRRALADHNRTPRRRWWWPKEVVSAETATLIANLATIGTMAGYLGVLIGQTIAFAGADFGAGEDVQANTLAAVRVGVLLSTFLLGRADRTGRRPLALRFALAAIVFTALGSLSPGMLALGGTQTIARGLTTGLLTLITLAATEEVPASARALAISFMTLTTGFGAALVVWILPVADLFVGAWRISYVVPLVFLPLLWFIARTMPETRRYIAATNHDAPAPINRWRFALIAGSAFASAVYLSPASQLRNTFLTDDLGYSATDVSLFQLTISLPATVAVPIGGYIADRYGRRWLGASALAGASLLSAASYQTSGALLWLTAGVGVSLAAAALPALRGYQTELFPTRARGRVGGLIDAIGVGGSALGLVVVGQLATRSDDLGTSIGMLVFAPLIVAVVIIVAYPETAGRELEEFNPDDPRVDDAAR